MEPRTWQAHVIHAAARARTACARQRVAIMRGINRMQRHAGEQSRTRAPPGSKRLTTACAAEAYAVARAARLRRARATAYIARKPWRARAGNANQTLRYGDGAARRCYHNARHEVRKAAGRGGNARTKVRYDGAAASHRKYAVRRYACERAIRA